MPKLGNALDFSQFEGRNFRAHQLNAAPSSPVTGQLYFDTTPGVLTLFWWDGSAWISAKGGTAATPPATTLALGTIQLAGDLAGTATNPQIAANVITDVDVNAANKDGAVGTASMRTLGPGAQQAAPGNDARFTNARAPTAHATTHQPGGSDPMIVDALVGTGVGSLRTLGFGANQAMAGNTPLNMITPAADIPVGSFKITYLGDPTLGTDAANKQYVDNMVQGLDAKNSARAVAVSNVALTGAQTIDGIILNNGERVLCVGQTNPAQNGVYIHTTGAWSRAPDMDNWNELPSSYVWIEQGTQYADTGWLCTTDVAGGTLGTTPITWVQFSGASQITAGAGLTKTGNQLDVGAGAGITVNADTIQVANNGITNAMIADGAIALNTPDVTGALPVTNGGTGQTTAKAARETGLGSVGYYTNLGVNGTGTTIGLPQSSHGLRAGRGIIVQCQDSITGAVEYPDVVVAANGDVTITYGAALTANSKLITLVG